MTHRSEWEFYFTKISNELSSVFVDLGFYNVAPLFDKNNLVWISIKINNPREDGLSSQEESKILDDIEDALAEKLMSNHNSVYVGRITYSGNREFYFYFGDTTLYDKTISEIMIAFPNYEYEFGNREDKEWRAYFDFLFPSPQEYQSIKNRKVTEKLKEYGDNLLKPREVHHWIYFKSINDREKFIEKVKNENFITVNINSDNSQSEYIYCLQIKRIDKVDQTSIDNCAIYLWNIANELNAKYDGWETSIESE